MPAVLSKDDIARLNGRYLPTPQVQKINKPELEPAPALDSGAIARAIETLAQAMVSAQLAQRAEIAEMLSALAAPKPAQASWKVTVTRRDQLGRIAELEFKRNA